MKLELTARSQSCEGQEYVDIERFGLESQMIFTGGNGTADSPWGYEIEICNPTAQMWKGIIHAELVFEKTNPRFFLPGFMYGRNRGEAPLYVPNEFPRLREGTAQRLASSWWMTRSDRLSHPAAFVYNGEEILGVCASPYFLHKEGKKIPWFPGEQGIFYQYTGFSCSLDKGSIGYTLGYENAPWLFVQSHKVKKREKLDGNCFQIFAGERVAFTMEVFQYKAEAEKDVFQAVQHVYEQYHESPRKAGTIQTAAEDISRAVDKEAWIEKEHSYSGFVFEDGGERRYERIYSLTWTNGLSVAVPMLMAAFRTGQEEIRRHAVTCIDFMVQNSLNLQTGLPYGAYDSEGNWSNHGWWFDGMHNPGHSGYLIGQAVYYILKAWQYERDYGQILHEEWIEYARKVIQRIKYSRNGDGEYPYIFSEITGAGMEYDSLGSSWCLAAAACYSYLTGETDELEELKKSEEHYYDTFVKKAEGYGGPLDTDKAVDSEGILAYIRALPWLHKLTGEEKYLGHLREALNYEFTFKFCYNSPIQIPPLSKVGWSSCGGSITSVANPHIHPMSSGVIDEMFYYLEYRKDAYIRSRLEDTIWWSCQTYNHYDKEYDYGFKGWMSERFCHSQGLLVQRYKDNTVASTWFALMPWACGCVLEGVCGVCWEKEIFMMTNSGRNMWIPVKERAVRNI